MGVLHAGMVVTHVAVGVTHVATVVIHARLVVMHAATVVTHAGTVVMHEAGQARHVGLEVTCVATVVMHEGAVVSQGPAGVREIPGAVWQLARWVFYVVARVGHGLGRMGPISAALMRVSTSAGPRRKRPLRAQARSPGFQSGVTAAAPHFVPRAIRPLPIRAPSGATARRPRFPGLKPGATFRRPQGALPTTHPGNAWRRQGSHHRLFLAKPFE
jgi:hypothetical protein